MLQYLAEDTCIVYLYAWKGPRVNVKYCYAMFGSILHNIEYSVMWYISSHDYLVCPFGHLVCLFEKKNQMVGNHIRWLAIISDGWEIIFT